MSLSSIIHYNTKLQWTRGADNADNSLFQGYAMFAAVQGSSTVITALRSLANIAPKYPKYKWIRQ